MTPAPQHNQDLRTFYGLARRTRAGVLDWLESLPPEVLTLERDDFAYGSLSAIYAHIADCYLTWIGTRGLGHKKVEVSARDMQGLREAFTMVDATAAAALDSFTAPDEPFEWTSPTGWTTTLTQRWLFLHTITHEFHHKGQALALARVLGHPHPGKPDTDLVDPLP
jgi:uncharacterized damage-inducible protein DinB